MLSVGQQSQSQEAQSYPTEPSVAQGAPGDGGGLGDPVDLSVVDGVPVGEELQGKVGEEADFLGCGEYLPTTGHLNHL